MRLVLPWPPSINNYWRNVKGRVLISKAGRQYRTDVIKLCRGRMTDDAKLYVSIEAFPPDKRRRDLDNIPKALLDALEKGGIYKDDSLIDHLEIIRMEPVNLGKVIVTIEEICDAS